MASIRKYELTKQDLIDNGYFVEGEKVFKQCNSRRWGNGVREIKQNTITNKNKYGVGKRYICVSLIIKRINNGKQRFFGLHNVIYAWYKGEVPLGYDVDHIDGDSLNNNIDNLELVTHEENLKRRSIKGVNQWYYIKGYDEESWLKRKQELKNKEEETKLRKELKPQYDLYLKTRKAEIKKAYCEDDLKKWHELINNKITFKEFVDKYKEDLL